MERSAGQDHYQQAWGKVAADGRGVDFEQLLLGA